MIKLIVALGNPGPEYELTRHNIGWLAIDQLTFFDQLKWQHKFKGLYSGISINGEKIHFLKPQTYMNLSGESVQPLLHFFKLNPKEMMVVHDELDLPFGEIGFKLGGGLAGHNGLKSIASILGTQDFYRLRLGISRPSKGSTSDWVLGNFSAAEEKHLSTFLRAGAESIERTLEKGYEKAASEFSKKNFAL